MSDKPESALTVSWEAPGALGLIMVLACDPDGGILNVSIEDGAVTMTGKNCTYATTDAERERKSKKPISRKKLQEFQFTVPLSRCQIVWKFVE